MEKTEAEKIQDVQIEDLSKDQRSLLLFLESRQVDYGGRVKLAHMNEDDLKIVEKWKKEEFLQFGRICTEDHNPLEYRMQSGTHWINLSLNAWILAHKERRNRAKRMWADKKWLSTEDKRRLEEKETEKEIQNLSKPNGAAPDCKSGEPSSILGEGIEEFKSGAELELDPAIDI